MPDPFGEQMTPWWRDSDWWRKQLLGSKSVVPTRYSRPVAAVSALVVFSTIGMHLDPTTKLVVGAFAGGVPSILLDWWWKRRRRYESEQLLVLPEVGSGGPS